MKPLKACFTAVALCCWCATQAAPEPVRPPNVILILADDLGWADLACYGSDFYETPHLDRLAREGMRFTQNYSACTVCSPTRAALLTGKLIEFFDDTRVELYHLGTDIGEQHDLAAALPDKVAELRARLDAWRRAVGAQLPVPNPRYDPAKPQYNPPPKRSG